MGSIESLLDKLKKYDKDTYEHSVRVSKLAEEMAISYKLDEEDVRKIKLAGLLHDIGKLKTPISILNKNGKLTNEEYEVVKKHPEDGYRTLCDYNIEEEVRIAVLLHHENEDGSGYPMGATGDRISLYAKIIHLADVYDALVNKRVYKEAYPIKSVKKIMEKEKNYFDTNLYKLFKKSYFRFV